MLLFLKQVDRNIGLIGDIASCLKTIAIQVENTLKYKKGVKNH